MIERNVRDLMIIPFDQFLAKLPVPDNDPFISVSPEQGSYALVIKEYFHASNILHYINSVKLHVWKYPYH